MIDASPLPNLTRELGISKQAVSQLIDTMVMRGYLERHEDPADRRRMLIALTPRGRAAARVSWEAASEVDAALASQLTPAGVEALRTGLRTLAAMGWAMLLPQMLATLGAIFQVSGVGIQVGKLATAVLPEDSLYVAVVVYCVGMFLFTTIMGNAFAAFPVMTAAVPRRDRASRLARRAGK